MQLAVFCRRGRHQAHCCWGTCLLRLRLGEEKGRERERGEEEQERGSVCVGVCRGSLSGADLLETATRVLQAHTYIRRRRIHVI